MLDNVEWLGHSTIKFNGDKIIYTDPFNIKNSYMDADIIFITHSHYDHFSKEDIIKCKKENTKIIITEDLYNESVDLGFDSNNIISVLPNNHYEVDGISFDTIPAYNINKNFHPKDNNWVGYIIDINNIKYYVAGDTDSNNDVESVKCDVAFLPIGGKFTMDYNEAANLANLIKPKIVVPIHYGTIIGSREDAINFKNSVDSSIKCEIL